MTDSYRSKGIDCRVKKSSANEQAEIRATSDCDPPAAVAFGDRVASVLPQWRFKIYAKQQQYAWVYVCCLEQLHGSSLFTRTACIIFEESSSAGPRNQAE